MLKGGDKMISKKKILPALTLAVIGVSILGITPVRAQTKDNNFFSGFVQFFAQKFGLDKTKVQSAFNEYDKTQQQNMQKKRQDNEKNRLDKLVSEGKITGDQEQKILDELAVLNIKYNPANSKDLSADERKKQFDAEQADIKAWADANKIDAKYLMPGFGGMGFRGMHKGNWGTKPTPTPTS